MSRLAKTLILALILVGMWMVAAATAAQEVPLPTALPDQPGGAATLPPADAPTLVPPTETATLSPEQLATASAPTPTPTPALGLEQTEALPVLINDRADLELLATTAIGSAQRPVGWSGSIDVSDPQLPLWIRLDLETLAGAVMGADKRPAGWFGVVPSIPLAVARDIRHDLELLADVVVGAPGLRPAGWKGDDPMMRCSRATQALFTMLLDKGLTIPVDFSQPDYCDTAEKSASLYVERQILQPPAAASSLSNQGRYPFQVDNPFVVAFLDRKAQHKIGVLPIGMGFTPESRSYVDFSNMMLVRGDGFEVFVDYTTTQITRDQFLSLPDVGDGSPTNCQAEWCGKGLD